MAVSMLSGMAETWEKVVGVIPVGISIHSADGTVLMANRFLGAIYGISPKLMLGRTCVELFHGEYECPHSDVVASGVGHEVVTVLGERAFRVSLNPIRSGGDSGSNEGPAYVRSMADILDIKSAPGRTGRGDALERIISGVAHDVGTPLNIISGYSEYLLMRTKAGEPGYKELSTILIQTRRISDSIRQMLDSSRASILRLDAIGLKGFLGELINLLGQNLEKSGVKAELLCLSLPPMIYGDAPKLRQAFFNILTDSISRIGDGGVLTIGLAAAEDRQSVEVTLSARNGSDIPVDLTEAYGQLTGDSSRGPAVPDMSLSAEVLESFRAEFEYWGDRGLGLLIKFPANLEPGCSSQQLPSA